MCVCLSVCRHVCIQVCVCLCVCVICVCAAFAIWNTTRVCMCVSVCRHVEPNLIKTAAALLGSQYVSSKVILLVRCNIYLGCKKCYSICVGFAKYRAFVANICSS